MLSVQKLAERLRGALPQIQGGRKVLVTSPPTLINHVSLYLVCSPIHAGASKVLFLSVDRPNQNIARLLQKHCSGAPSVLFANPEMDAAPTGEISCVTGLFAPKLMVEALGQMNIFPNGKASMVVGNLSALGYYNSNDRIREFMKKLEEKLRDETLLKVVLVADRSSSYIFSMAREFADREVDLSG